MTPLLKQRVKVVRNLLKSFRLPSDVAERHVLEVAQDLWYRIDTPTSLGLFLCCKYGDFTSILTHEVDPSKYNSSETFYLDHQAVSFLRKCPLSVVTAAQRRASALEKFKKAEEQCRATNSRFRARSRSELSSSGVESVLFRAQRKIFSWIGEGPNPRDWLERCRFGPGADNIAKGNRVGSYHKLSALSATAEFADGALAMAIDHPAWCRGLLGIDPFDLENQSEHELSITLAQGNTVVFVPKNAMIDRSIAIEPRMNIFAQLGLGGLLRDFLKKRGKLDLDTQFPNQDLAYDSSLYGHLATIDLSMASDTIAIEVVRDLLPPGWFTALDWVRSHNGIDPETRVPFRYEKFSSMGNGFTFELESLIFFSLTLACCEYLGLVNYYTRVFGDDIICPVEAVALLEEVLHYCGFTINKRKSFSSGCFRESCGADFFDGTNVRPHFVTEVPTDAKSLFNLANGIFRASCRLGRGLFRDRRFRPAWIRAVRRVPEPFRGLFTPVVIRQRYWGLEVEAGNGGFIPEQDEFLSALFTRFNREYQAGYNFGTIVSRSWKERGLINPSVLYAYALYRGKDGIKDGVEPGIVTGRGSVGDRLFLGAYAPSLADFGPWL